jgi:hypothetical protein
MRCIPLLLLPVAACGTDHGSTDVVDCSMITGADEFVVGLQKDGDGAKLDYSMMSADPAPPQRGDNTWIIRIDDVAAGAPLENATLDVVPFMPAHGHDSPKTVNITAGAVPGEYVLSPVNLWMPGVWETTIKATSMDGTMSDTALYTFCIN